MASIFRRDWVCVPVGVAERLFPLLVLNFQKLSEICEQMDRSLGLSSSDCLSAFIVNGGFGRVGGKGVKETRKCSRFVWTRSFFFF